MRALTVYASAAALVLTFAACGKKGAPTPAKGKAATPAPTAAPAKETAVVAEGPLNLRDKPSTDGAILGRLATGEKVLLLETSDKEQTIDGRTAPWYKVETIEKKQGWVFGGYLKKNAGAGTAAPTASAAAPANAPLVAINVAAASESGWRAADYYKAGKDLLNAQRFGDALPYLKAATEGSPQTGGYWADLGLTLLELSRYDEAVTAYERAVVLRPTDFWAHNNLGLACIKSRRPGRAVEALEKAATLEPKGTSDPAAAKAVARKNLAAAYELNGQADKAAALR